MFFFLECLTKQDIECTCFEEGSVLTGLRSCWLGSDSEKEHFLFFCFPSSECKWRGIVPMCSRFDWRNFLCLPWRILRCSIPKVGCLIIRGDQGYVEFFFNEKTYPYLEAKILLILVYIL